MAHAIQAQGLSKIYRLGEIGTGTISNDLKRWIVMSMGKEDPFLKVGEENVRSAKGGDVVYSLRDLDFAIEQGDTVGVIGKNGAGKSTLLKILSRVTSPTTGKVSIRGRVASLLEVGTGFHPELTGRENIFLNGAILGMRRQEIRRKFDEIVAFSGVDRYIDTPVKRYSSGMYVRLAFAVSAHLESEILIVDEVLAVGDAEFQNKCLGKMSDVSKSEGKTVLFVSHNLHAVKNLCRKGLLMANGRKQFYGDVAEAVRIYGQEGEDEGGSLYESAHKEKGTWIQRVQSEVKGNQPVLELHLDMDLRTEMASFRDLLVVDIFDAYGTCVYQVIPDYTPFIGLDGTTKKYRLTVEMVGLKPGTYSVNIWLGPDFKHEHEWLKKAVTFKITEPPEEGRTMPYIPNEGFIVPRSNITEL